MDQSPAMQSDGGGVWWEEGVWGEEEGDKEWMLAKCGDAEIKK